jgi:hypothetical protein
MVKRLGGPVRTERVERLLRFGHIGGDEAIEVLAATIDLDLEIAGAATDPARELGVTPQPKCSKASSSASQVARTAGPRRWVWPCSSRAKGRT